MSGILKVAGQIAGIGGLAIGLATIIFREVIHKNIFPNLTKHQAFRLIRLIVILTWSIALAGIAAWVVTSLTHPSEPGTPTVSLVVDLSEPISEQVQLFAEDRVEVFAPKDRLKEVWFGDHWEDFVPDRRYIVCGVPGKPVTPAFKAFEGKNLPGVKLVIYPTRDRDKPRNL